MSKCTFLSDSSQSDLLFVFVSHQNTPRFFQKVFKTSACNSRCLLYAFVSGSFERKMRGRCLLTHTHTAQMDSMNYLCLLKQNPKHIIGVFLSLRFTGAFALEMSIRALVYLSSFALAFCSERKRSFYIHKPLLTAVMNQVLEFDESSVALLLRLIIRYLARWNK